MKRFICDWGFCGMFATRYFFLPKNTAEEGDRLRPMCSTHASHLIKFHTEEFGLQEMTLDEFIVLKVTED